MARKPDKHPMRRPPSGCDAGGPPSALGQVQPKPARRRREPFRGKDAMDPDEASQDLKTLRSVAGGLTPKHGAIYVLLVAIYQVGRKWRNRGASKTFREELLQREGVRVDRRVKKTIFRLLIELTYPIGTKLKSRYANALEYARLHDCPSAGVGDFLRSRGIERCAKRYVAYRRKTSRSKRTTR